MIKTIKLDNRVYDQLDQLRERRDTFSDVVARPLTTKEGVDTLIGVWYRTHGERKADHDTK